MLDIDCMKEDFDPIKKSREYFAYKRKFWDEHPDYFEPDGLCLFVGMQGKGKTLSAVNYVYKLMEKYPKCKLVTNLMLKDYQIVTFEEWKIKNLNFIYKVKNCGHKLENEEFEKMIYECYKIENRVFAFNNQDDLQEYRNGERGIIYLIDEIQLYFNSLESKNINMEVMAAISQQRKQRIHIIGTSQVFGRMAKPLREQFNVVIDCKNYLGFIQCNSVVNRDDITEDTDSMAVEGKVMRKCWYIHTPRYYSRYDTYYTISRTKFVGNEKKVRDYNVGRTNATNN